MSFPRRKIIRALEQVGCRFLREGSRHTIYLNNEGRIVQVPRHGEVRRGTARSIARQAGVEWQNFEREIS